MYYVKEIKKKKEYVLPQRPEFKTKKSELAWLKREKRKAELLNIKYIQIQVKDIKQFIHSNDKHLLRMYDYFFPFYGLTDEDYIKISKFKEGNDLIISAILSTDWLLNGDLLSQICDEIILNDIAFLEERLEELNKRNETDEVKKWKAHCIYKLETLKEEMKRRGYFSLKLV